MDEVQELLLKSVSIVNEELAFVGIQIGIEEAVADPVTVDRGSLVLWCHGEFVPHLHRSALLTVDRNGVRVALPDTVVTKAALGVPKRVFVHSDAYELVLDVVSAMLIPSEDNIVR